MENSLALKFLLQFNAQHIHEENLCELMPLINTKSISRIACGLIECDYPFGQIYEKLFFNEKGYYIRNEAHLGKPMSLIEIINHKAIGRGFYQFWHNGGLDRIKAIILEKKNNDNIKKHIALYKYFTELSKTKILGEEITFRSGCEFISLYKGGYMIDGSMSGISFDDLSTRAHSIFEIIKEKYGKSMQTTNDDLILVTILNKMEQKLGTYS